MKICIKGGIVLILGMLLLAPITYAHKDESSSDDMYEEMHEGMKGGHGKMKGHSMMKGKRDRRHGMMHMGRDHSLLHFKEELGLTEEQIAELKKLRSEKKEIRKELIRKGAEIAIAETELSDLLDQDKIDISEIEKKVKEITALHGDMRLYWIKSIIKVKEILTDEQYKRYREISGTEWMRGGPSSGPWGPWGWH